MRRADAVGDASHAASSFFSAANGKHGFDPYPYILLNRFLSMSRRGSKAGSSSYAAKRSVRPPAARAA